MNVNWWKKGRCFQIMYFHPWIYKIWSTLGGKTWNCRICRGRDRSYRKLQSLRPEQLEPVNQSKNSAKLQGTRRISRSFRFSLKRIELPFIKSPPWCWWALWQGPVSRFGSFSAETFRQFAGVRRCAHLRFYSKCVTAAGEGLLAIRARCGQCPDASAHSLKRPRSDQMDS